MDVPAPSGDIDSLPRLPFPVVGIGASAGGMEAMTELFQAMPAKTGMAFVIIQHLPPDRESLVAEILGKHTALPVQEITDGVEVGPDRVYIIRPGNTVTIRHGRLHLSAPLEKPGHRRPVDDFFRSLAEEQRERAVGVILSGMGSNGTAGAQAIKAVGGMCIAQEPESARFASMPRSLFDSGHADFVLRPSEIPEVLIRYCAHPYTQRREEISETEANRDRQALGEILAVLRTRMRHDFTGYKKPTLLRRVQRRMGLNQMTAMTDYARLLRQNPNEVASLSDDLMIHVTGFFRDPEVWEALREAVILPLIAERLEETAIRAWVTACASGEEAYTLGILLLEAVEASGKNFDIKIFATDTAERTLNHARNGVYPNGIESEISPERLERFFEKDDTVYRVKKELRELVVFAPQNILQDPPFSRLDLCTCRNLLIYLEPEIQRRALSLMHFALRENGVLLLGNSETVTGAEELFEPIDKKHRLYRRTGPTRHSVVEFPLPHALTLAGEGEGGSPRSAPRTSIAQQASRALLDRFSPAAVVIDRQQRIVFFHGNTEQFLDQPRGEPTRELLTLVREPVRGAVRTALHKAMLDHGPATVRDGHLETPRGRVRIEVNVAPLARGNTTHFLVCFQERPDPPPLVHPEAAAGKENLRQLQEELQRVRDELQSTIEELQTSNEEMKASNEEATSINEELQSTNEELETSKEELQSLNEELTTVNSQLQTKMEELEGTTNDLSSLLSSTNIAVIFLDSNFRIRRFTPAVKDLLDLIPSDVGRPLNDLARKFSDDRLLPDAQVVLEKLVPIEREIASESGRVYVRGVLPYRTTDNRIDGVVITFIDITSRKRAETALSENEERHQLIFDGLKEYAIFMADPTGQIVTWHQSAERIFGFTATEAIGQSMAMIFPAGERSPEQLHRQLQDALHHGNIATESWYARKDGTRFWGSGNIAALLGDRGQLRGYVKVLRDNTDRKAIEEALKQAKSDAESANTAKDNFLANISHELRTPLSATLLWSKLLRNQKKLNPKRLREGLDAIEKSAREQQTLIEDLVDTSRIVAGKLRLQLTEVPLRSIAQVALEAIKPAAAEKKITVEDFLDPKAGTVCADAQRLQQVLSNLLHNAVKFTPANGKVSLHLERNEGVVEFRVADTGKGIAPEFIERVFERFTQADSIESSSGGLGLGLSIARQLVELHGGSLTVKSDGLAKGSVFTVRLPLPAVCPAKVRRPRRRHVSLRGVKILLVEDDAETRKALAAALTEAGAKVTRAESAPLALKAFNRQRPDLILSDIGLGKVSGHDLIGQIREWERAQKAFPVPAAALTAYADNRNRTQALQSGFQRVLTKPVAAQDLVRALSELLGESNKD